MLIKRDGHYYRNGNEITAEEYAAAEQSMMNIDPDAVPAEIPQEPTNEQRIAQLEEELAAAKILLGVE